MAYRVKTGERVERGVWRIHCLKCNTLGPQAGTQTIAWAFWNERKEAKEAQA